MHPIFLKTGANRACRLCLGSRRVEGQPWQVCQELLHIFDLAGLKDAAAEALMPGHQTVLLQLWATKDILVERNAMLCSTWYLFSLSCGAARASEGRRPKSKPPSRTSTVKPCSGKASVRDPASHCIGREDHAQSYTVRGQGPLLAREP